MTAANKRTVHFWVIMQRNNPEERSSHLLRGGSLKSRKLQRHFTAAAIQTLDTNLAAVKEQPL